MKTQILLKDIAPGGLFERFVFPAAFRKRINETRFKQYWRLTKLQYACLMLGWNGEGDAKKWLANYARQFKGPARQRGSILLSAFGLQTGGGGGGTVSLSPQGFSSFDAGNGCISRAVFQSDGTLVHNDDGTLTDKAAGEWNSAEPSATGANFEVRYTAASKTGDAYTTPAAPGDTWIRIDADRSWGHVVTAPSSPNLKTSNATFELGDYLASSADDSANLSITAEN